jgi:hypothetical protein
MPAALTESRLTDNKAPLLNVLCAYPYMAPSMLDVLKRNQGQIRFVLDSGAFTAWKAGKPIALDDYCRFLEILPIRPWRYFALDVIGEPAATLRNYEAMLRRGFKPIPIFTRGEDPSVIDDYYKTSDVVGIGGLVGTPRNRGFINGIMKHVGNRHCHWLGFTALEFLKHYRPYMCDSSSWESGARFGAFSLYLGDGRKHLLRRSEFARKPSAPIIAALASYGVDPNALAREQAWHGGTSLNRRLNAGSGVRLSLEIQKHIGTLYFLALTTQRSLQLLIDAYDFERNRSCPRPSSSSRAVQTAPPSPIT